jgi:hypothetical protein
VINDSFEAAKFLEHLQMVDSALFGSSGGDDQ